MERQLKKRVPHELELTGYTTRGVLHYTCNNPSDEHIEALGITPMGNQFWHENPRDLFLIPEDAYLALGLKIRDDNPYRSFGYDPRTKQGVHDNSVLQHTSENLMKLMDTYTPAELKNKLAKIKK